MVDRDSVIPRHEVKLVNIRRHRLAKWAALQASAGTPRKEDNEIADLRIYPVREPVSGRTYTIVKAHTRSGLTGFGECGRVSSGELDKARSLMLGRAATAYATASTGTPMDAGLNMALLDITAKACAAPVYRLLGGPTRHKIRAMAALHGNSDEELKRSLAAGRRAGFRAFQVPIPKVTARNQGKAFDRAAHERMESLRSAGGEHVEFVLDAAGALSPGDAASLASSLEKFHLLWFNEPCTLSNLRTLQKISDESVTPLGFGRHIEEASVFQDMMRDGVVDVVRPDLLQHGISRIRQVATLAETYYTAVAPNHEGGAVATAAALHLAASLPNFFIQHIPWPVDEKDRRMRSEIVPQPVENVLDGFIPLPAGTGFGIEVSEAALEKYRDTSA